MGVFYDGIKLAAKCEACPLDDSAEPLYLRPFPPTRDHIFRGSPIDGDRHVATSRSMAVPKRKQSNSRTGMRRAHDFKVAKQLNSCPQCSTMIPSHVVCPNCGYYMGRTVVEAPTEKSEK